MFCYSFVETPNWLVFKGAVYLQFLSTPAGQLNEMFGFAFYSSALVRPIFTQIMTNQSSAEVLATPLFCLFVCFEHCRQISISHFQPRSHAFIHDEKNPESQDQGLTYPALW